MSNLRIERVWIEWQHDDDPDTSYLEQEEFEDRLRAWKNDEFTYLGCIAHAKVSYQSDLGGSRSSNFSSLGCWGIESDSYEDHFEDIARQELADLKTHLEAFGVDTADFEKLVEGIQLVP